MTQQPTDNKSNTDENGVPFQEMLDYGLTDLVYQWHGFLGGNAKKFDKETIRRCKDYFISLKQKRDYEKFQTFDSDNDSMVVANHLRVFSYCEHHLMPFFGECSIGYIPSGKILGLSKFQRLVDKYASKVHLQENLTTEIGKAMEQLLQPRGCGVVIKAIHTCVFARGVQSASAEFTTTDLRGVFKEKKDTRDEFLAAAVIFANNRSSRL